MTRLDQHVRRVQARQSASTLLRSAAWAGTALAGAVLLVLLIDRLFGYQMPHAMRWAQGAACVAAAGAAAWTIWHRPDVTATGADRPAAWVA
jgi:uncharacterized membrane protein